MIKLLDYLEKKEDLVCGGGKDDSSIREAEEKLGLSFADDYKSYLKRYGVASFEGHELTGLCRSKRLSVIEKTIAQRELNDSVLPDMYVVEDLAIDGIIVLQNGAGEIFMLFSYDNEISKVADSLVGYLEKG